MQINAHNLGMPIQAGLNATDCTTQDPNVRACERCNVAILAHPVQIYTWNTGLYLQGTAVLSSITGNDTYLTA